MVPSSSSPATVASRAFLSPVLSHVVLVLFLISSTLDSFGFFLVWQFGVASVCGGIFWTQYRRNHFLRGIIIRSLLLGLVFTIGTQIALLGYLFKSDDSEESSSSFSSPSSWILLSCGLYLLTLSIFHFTEFLTTALNQPHTVSTDAFLLNHSLEYHAALAISMCEFGIESYFGGKWKFYFPVVIFVGFGMCMTGEAIRKVAMLTAGKNFTHIVADEHHPEHFLVTDGIYAIWRHPSYVGWFYWSIGTQILLCNPISLIGYTIVSWRFFSHRIYFEEVRLANFFGAKYLKYKDEVPTGLPFIDGF